MVLDFYKLKEQPFGVTPDPHYLHMSASQREALASLFQGGFWRWSLHPGWARPPAVPVTRALSRVGANHVLVPNTMRLLRAVALPTG
jgi:hypothetical protein